MAENSSNNSSTPGNANYSSGKATSSSSASIYVPPTLNSTTASVVPGTQKPTKKTPKKQNRKKTNIDPHFHFTYDLGKGFEGEFDFSSGVVSQSTPDAVIRVFPYKERVTRGRNLSSAQAMAIGPVVELDPVCTNIEISYNKRSHIGQFAGTFIDADNQLLQLIAPGDWMMVWMGPKQYMDMVRVNVKNEEQANYFHSGLKFVGKVTSVRRVVTVQPNGMVMRRVSITGAAFAEFDTAVYFNPALISEDQLGIMFSRSLSSSIESFIANNGVLSTSFAIPTFISLFLGGGAGGTYNKQLKKQISPNTSFWAPSVIGKLLNRNMGSNAKHFSYADMLTRMYGLHKYSVNKAAASNAEPDFKGFLPILNSYESDNTYWTPYGLMGKFAPQLTPWTGVPIWGILSQFLNPAVNEMYTTLRMSPTGDITPHFILRQIPFNTPEFAERGTMATSFLNLPRWRPQKQQVVGFDVGTSEALRNNFAYVRGQPVYRSYMEDAADVATIQPQSDYWDIARSGLCPLLGTVASELSVIGTGAGSAVETEVKDQQGNVTKKLVIKGNPNSYYTAIAADRGFGSHLKFTGSMNLKGVLEPVAVGDNLEYEGVVYHVEQIAHSLSVAPNGMKSFNTRLSLSNGVDAITGGPPELVHEPAEEDSSNSPATTFDQFEE